MQTAQNELVSLRIQMQSKDDINRNLLDEVIALRCQLDECTPDGGGAFASITLIIIGMVLGVIETLAALGAAAHFHWF